MRGTWAPLSFFGCWQIYRSWLLIWTLPARGAPEASLPHQLCQQAGLLLLWLVLRALISMELLTSLSENRGPSGHALKVQHTVNDWLLLGLRGSFRSLTSGPVTPKPRLWIWRKHRVFLGLSLRLIWWTREGFPCSEKQNLPKPKYWIETGSYEKADLKTRDIFQQIKRLMKDQSGGKNTMRNKSWWDVTKFTGQLVCCSAPHKVHFLSPFAVRSGKSHYGLAFLDV